jgi:hypothetical protein
MNGEQTNVSMTISVLVTTSLMMRREMILKILAYSPFNHLTLLLAGEYFIEFSRRESFKLNYTAKEITQTSCQ